MSFIKYPSVIICATSASLLGVGYWFWHSRSRCRGRSDFPFKTVPVSIHIVNTRSQWDQLYPKIVAELKICKVLGIDCEWVTLTSSKCPVSLLQLATPSGVCILIQLLQLGDFPDSLRDLLADKSVLKTGVGCLGDARKLLCDHALLVQGCVDLRHLAVRARLRSSGLSLKALTNTVLGADLDKNLLIRAGNWELERLTPEQVNYAAMDGLVGVKIFLVLLNKKLGCPLVDQYEPITEEQNWAKVLSMCQGIIDIPFLWPDYRAKPPRSEASGQPSTTISKPSRAYKHRQRPLYHNCQLRAPDGQLLCTCDMKKALWYIDKHLGEKICDDPLTIRLKFEPSGRPVNEKNYYLQDKVNKCVVCGKEDSYIRKNIIPHDYRKHFPQMLKEHRSHDIVLMCSMCHQRSNLYDSALVERFARECNAPTGSDNGMKFKLDHSLQKVKSAAKALLNTKAKIPPGRCEELRDLIKAYYGVDSVTHGLLVQAVEIDVMMPNHSFIPHGEKVIQHIVEHSSLVDFERMWRQHFLDSMKPQHLPPLWSVHHSHNELADMDQSLRCTISDM